jgi:HK97 family phage major capsid protein
MIKDRRAGPICTGKLEADHPAYGQGAREIVHTGPLQHFKGHDAVQRAYMVGQWFKSAAGDARAAAWCRDNGIVATRVMTESVFSNGGAVVPAMVAAEILSNVDQYGTYRRFARNWPLEVASLSVPTNNEGLTMGAVGENTATTASDLSLGAVTLIPKEFAGGVRISRALLEDSAPNLADFLTGELARALAKTEDLAGWVGDSSSTYAGMSGMFNRIKNDAACAGSKITAAAATHDTFAEIDVTDLVTLMGALPEYARIGAAWYCSGTARDLVFSRLTATAGGNNTQTLSAALSENYLGYPIRTSPVLPAGAATDYSGECMLAFGNLAMAAAFGDRRQLQVEFDLSRYIEYRQAYLQISSRFDIVNHLQGVSATVAGPLVALVGGAS